jgi:hypothetical protein
MIIHVGHHLVRFFQEGVILVIFIYMKRTYYLWSMVSIHFLLSSIDVAGKGGFPYILFMQSKNLYESRAVFICLDRVTMPFQVATTPNTEELIKFFRGLGRCPFEPRTAAFQSGAPPLSHLPSPGYYTVFIYKHMDDTCSRKIYLYSIYYTSSIHLHVFKAKKVKVSFSIVYYMNSIFLIVLVSLSVEERNS